MAVIAARAPATSPARNRSNAPWLRAQIDRLRADLLRAEAYGGPQLSSSEVRARLAEIFDGKEPQG